MFAAIDETLLRNLCTHVTAGMLSHQIAGLEWLKFFVPTASSSASQCIKMPSNSKSEIVMVPDLFALVHSCAETFSGHLQYHTNGVSFREPPNHTPPTPHPEASTSPL